MEPSVVNINHLPPSTLTSQHCRTVNTWRHNRPVRPTRPTPSWSKIIGRLCITGDMREGEINISITISDLSPLSTIKQPSCSILFLWQGMKTWTSNIIFDIFYPCFSGQFAVIVGQSLQSVSIPGFISNVWRKTLTRETPTFNSWPEPRSQTLRMISVFLLWSSYWVLTTGVWDLRACKL